jgi:hypothetical protein
MVFLQIYRHRGEGEVEGGTRVVAGLDPSVLEERPAIIEE